MTTEDDFQAALDAHPDDWQTRLVFADWLQERGDPRAEGYRALARLRRIPESISNESFWWFSSRNYCADRRQTLPQDWFDCLPKKNRTYLFPVAREKVRSPRRWVEDTAARAFAKLPLERRAELLATILVPDEKRVRKKPKRPKPRK